MYKILRLGPVIFYLSIENGHKFAWIHDKNDPQAIAKDRLWEGIWWKAREIKFICVVEHIPPQVIESRKLSSVWRKNVT